MGHPSRAADSKSDVVEERHRRSEVERNAAEESRVAAEIGLRAT